MFVFFTFHATIFMEENTLYDVLCRTTVRVQIFMLLNFRFGGNAVNAKFFAGINFHRCKEDASIPHMTNDAWMWQR